MQPQRLNSDVRSEADLSTSESRYFGKRLGQFQNLGGFPFRPSGGDLMRHSFVYQAIYAMGDDYGGIQLRARIHTYGPLPDRLREILRITAHRAAFMFDSGIETPGYGPAPAKTLGTKPGDGYLTGFNAVQSYANWESTEITAAEKQTEIGVVDWSTEIYRDEEFDQAALSGIAQGLAFPYRTETRYDPGEEPLHIPPHKWSIAAPSSRPDYYEIRPPARTKARTRYREGAGNGKRVYINGKFVATTDNKGRGWLKKEYASGDGWNYGGRWSRKGLVESPDVDGATWQAIRKGGTLYMTGETSEGIYLSTKRHVPDEWSAADPDSVPVDLEAKEGRPERTIHLLRVQDPDAGLSCQCRRDDNITGHLGKSNPDYTHNIKDGQSYPEGSA
jgi:hypothetical protein